MSLDSAEPPAHVMLTVLGLNPKPACYTFAGPETAVVAASLAPAALYNLLPKADRPDLILAVCTKAAENSSWLLLEEALGDRCELKRVEVADGESQEDIAAFLEKVATAVPEDVELTVDVTHGFRHFSFLTYIAVLYLNALRGARVRGAYYGLLGNNSPTRFLDLRPLLDLPDWIHALRVLRETGSALPMAKAIRDGDSKKPAQDLARDLSHLSEAYLSGLPIELGKQGFVVHEKLRRLNVLLRRDHRLPLSRELAKQFGDTLNSFKLNNPPSGDGWKGRVALSDEELDRQANLVDHLLMRGHRAAAIGLMREWTVSWAVFNRGMKDRWIEFHAVRHSTESMLGAISDVRQNVKLRECLTEEQRLLGEFWENLRILRNSYHHHGMRREPLVGERKAETLFQAVSNYWSEVLRKRPKIPLKLGGSSATRILATPIGKRPRVLFSALHAFRETGGWPGLCLVICSRDSEAGIEEAVRKAGYAGKIHRLQFEDPHGGLEEIECMNEAARSMLVGADEVLINVTGGTTLMGLAAEELATSARKLACPNVRRFGLVDRRPPSEQDAEPYKISERFWLDIEEAEHAD